MIRLSQCGGHSARCHDKRCVDAGERSYSCKKGCSWQNVANYGLEMSLACDKLTTAGGKRAYDVKSAVVGLSRVKAGSHAYEYLSGT